MLRSKGISNHVLEQAQHVEAEVEASKVEKAIAEVPQPEPAPEPNTEEAPNTDGEIAALQETISRLETEVQELATKLVIRHAALDLAQASLDLQLQYRAPVEIDLARFDLWAAQLLVDAAAADPGAVAGDVATLERVRDRIAHTFDAPTLGAVDQQLGALNEAVEADDLATTTEAGTQLRDLIATAQQAA